MRNTKTKAPRHEIHTREARVVIEFSGQYRDSDLHRICADLIDALDERGIPRACYVTDYGVVVELVGDEHTAAAKSAAEATMRGRKLKAQASK